MTVLCKSQLWFYIIFGVICFSLPSVYAAEVYYLGSASSTQGTAQTNPSYSLTQRIKDLLDFSTARKSDLERSGRISGSFSQEVDHNAVAGNKTKSFLQEGWDYLSELHINMQEKLFQDYNFEGQWFIRKTDNPRIDPRRDARLKQLSLRVSNPKNLYEFGDFYAEFSPFVLGASLEGFNIDLSPNNLSEYKFIAARTARADTTTDKYQRNVFGFKIDRHLFTESEIFSDFRVGAQVATTQDDSSTINRTDNTKDLRNTVFSVDGDFSFTKLFSFDYELAHSAYMEDEDALGSKNNQQSNAFRAQPAFQLGGLNLRYLYYYVQPKFYTDVGSASSDKSQHQVTAGYCFSSKALLTVTENYYWDHLLGSSRTKRTINDEKYVSLNLRPFDSRPDFMLRPYVNNLRRDSDDPGNTAASTTWTTGFSLNDVLAGDTSVGFSYEYRGVTDRANRSTSDYFNRIGFNLARDFRVFKRRLYCSLDPSFDIRSSKNDNDKDVTANLGFNVQYDASDKLKVKLGNTFADTNSALPAGDYFNNRGYWEFDYSLNKQRATHIVLRGERNNYTSENGNQSYREQRVIAKFISNF